MKKVSMSKLLGILQKIDNKIYIDHGIVIHHVEGQLFHLVNEAQEQEFIDYIENPKDCFDFNKRVLYAYLRQFKDEFIYTVHTKEEIREVIENKLHLEINDKDWIRYEDNLYGDKHDLVGFSNFVAIFKAGKKFNDEGCDVLATIVRKELENGK